MSGAENQESVELSTVIAAPAPTIFRFCTDPQRFSQWRCAATQIDSRPGGSLAVDFVAHATRVAGEVVEVVPDERIVFTWGVAEGAQAESIPVGSTTVTIELEREGDGTRVTLRHSGLPTAAERQEHTTGWTHYLEQLTRSAFEARLGEGLEDRLDAFCAAWSESDPVRRAELLGRSATEEFEYVDRHARVAGRAAFDAHIAAVQDMFPGVGVARQDLPRQCHEFAPYTWRVTGADSTSFGTGRNHVTLAKDGRARLIVALRG